MTILKRITRLEKGLVAVAIVTGLQMAIWLGMAIRYVRMCSKKQSKNETEDEMEDEWQESVTKMENCLKTNKKVRKEVRKEQREEARTREWDRKTEAMMEAQDARLGIRKHFLDTHKGVAESQL